MDYRRTNRQTWNQLADSGSLFARTATDEECRNPLRTLDGRGWLPNTVQDMEVLCLASGGGWQSVLYAAAGARVTVVDISESMLKLDQREAHRRGFSIRTLCCSMDDLSELHSRTFDIVHQPVSTCYVPDVNPVFQEIARVLRPDGIYISQHKQPVSLQISHRNRRDQFVIGVEYFHEGPLPEVADTSYRESGATEYLHRLDVLVGGICRSGMVIEDFREPVRADPKAPVHHFGYRGRFVPPYLRIKARRLAEPSGSPPRQRVWLPD